MLQNNMTQSAERGPNRIAYRYLNHSMTYEQLDRKSNQLSRQPEATELVSC